MSHWGFAYQYFKSRSRARLATYVATTCICTVLATQHLVPTASLAQSTTPPAIEPTSVGGAGELEVLTPNTRAAIQRFNRGSADRPTDRPTATLTAGLRRVMNGRPPVSVADLKQVQARIQDLTSKIMPATVAIRVGRANGSGVIIDQQGHVLTAAHVAGRPGRRATVHLPDGRELSARTLGMNQKLDAGLIQIINPSSNLPFVPLGKSSELKDGAFCLATGHPGGFDSERPPVLRWGRILRLEESAILTDCTLVGGDSGGPLFNLMGEVVGIHSRIGKNLTINVHVPSDTFAESWSRLAEGEMWGLLDEPSEDDASPRQAWLGVIEDPDATRARVLRVAPDSPAAQAALQAGDIITQIDDEPIKNFSELQATIRDQEPNQPVAVTILRDGDLITTRVRLGDRPAR